MTASIVQIWAPGDIVSANVVLYRFDDEDRFLLDVKPHIGPNVKTYKILPNGYPFLELIRIYFHLLEDPSNDWLDSIDHGADPRYVWLTRNFIRLKISLQSWDDRGALSAIATLLKNSALLHPDQTNFLEFCKSFLEKIFRQILWGSPIALDPTTSSVMARAWWAQPSALFQETDRQIKELKALFPPPVSRAGQSNLLNWLTILKNWLNSKLITGPPGPALLEASAMCHSLSRIHYSVGRYSLAVLLCHRSADLLLFSECATAGLVDFTANSGGGEYRHPLNNRRAITLIDSYETLVHYGHWISNTSRKARFDNLNRHRNHLLLTHYLGSLSAQVAKNLLHDTTNELDTIGGSTWKTARENIFQKIQIQERDFFEISDSLMNVVVPLPT